jgi:hypothetical protein
MPRSTYMDQALVYIMQQRKCLLCDSFQLVKTDKTFWNLNLFYTQKNVNTVAGKGKNESCLRDGTWWEAVWETAEDHSSGIPSPMLSSYHSVIIQWGDTAWFLILVSVSQGWRTYGTHAQSGMLDEFAWRVSVFDAELDLWNDITKEIINGFMKESEVWIYFFKLVYFNRI